MKLGNKKIIGFLIVGVILQQHQADAFLGLILGLAKFAWSAFEMFNEVHDTYSKFSTPSTADLMEKSEELAASVDSWGTKLEQKIQQSMDTLLSRLPLLGEIADDARLLNTYVARIDGLYVDFKEYLTHPEFFSDDAIEQMVKAFTSRDGDDVKGTIDSMHGLVVPGRTSGIKKSLFLLLAQETREYGLELCDTGAPPQQRIVDLYNIVMETEMRGFAMMGFGYTLRGVLENKTLTADIRRAEYKLASRAKLYMLVVKSTMELAALQFRRCDPPRGQKRDVTFYEFEKFIQAFIVQESALTEDHQCPEDCTGYTQPTKLHFGCIGFECELSPTSCYGRVTLCKSLGGAAKICQYDGSNTRRYEWFETGSGRIKGDDADGCPVPLTIADREVNKQTNCDLCRCVCMEDEVESKSSHFVSLRKQITDIDNNMVVTGLRLVIINETAHLKVQQGKLGPDGVIPENSTSWMEPENITYDREKSIESSEFKFIKKSEDGDEEEMIPDEDIGILTWDASSFYLDTLSVPDGYVLTGVRFNRITEKDWKPFYLEIHATRFDYETGQLYPNSTVWLTPEDMRYARAMKKRYTFEIDAFRSPIKSRKTDIVSKPYNVIFVDWTNYEDDAGQTTIPLLDALPVTSTPLVPLGGVGLYYKRQPGYAGFLTLVLEGVNLAAFIPDDVPE